MDTRLRLDAATGIIHLDGTGFWTPEHIEHVLDRLAALVATLHASGRRALVMVNLRSNGAQSATTVDRIRQRSASIYGPQDRLAVVLCSTLLKRQVGRVERAAAFGTFALPSEAEAWLKETK